MADNQRRRFGRRLHLCFEKLVDRHVSWVVDFGLVQFLEHATLVGSRQQRQHRDTLVGVLDDAVEQDAEMIDPLRDGRRIEELRVVLQRAAETFLGFPHDERDVELCGAVLDVPRVYGQTGQRP